MNELRASTLALSLLASVAATSPAAAGSLHGTVAATGMTDNAGAVVYVEEIPGEDFPPPAQHAVMDQRGLTFLPHVLAVQVGTTVDFHNSDSVAHNVFTPDACAGKFNLGTWGRGEVRSHTFDHTCAAEILCILHQDMDAWVVVVPTPYFAVTDAMGAYEIPDLPDGSYTVEAWHAKLAPVERRVRVAGSTEASFELGPRR